jgi:hypothetical protein
VTSYIDGTISPELRERARAAIEAAFDNGNLQAADNGLLDVSFRDLDLFPIDDAPTGSPTFGSPTDVSPTLAPNDGPTTRNRPSDEDSPLEAWGIALIAVGGAVTFLFAFLCLRRPSHSTLPEEDDDNEDGKSKSSGDGSKPEAAVSTKVKSDPFVPPQPRSNRPINEGSENDNKSGEDKFVDEPNQFGDEPKFEAASNKFGGEESTTDGEESNRFGDESNRFGDNDSSSDSASEIEEKSSTVEEEKSEGVSTVSEESPQTLPSALQPLGGGTFVADSSQREEDAFGSFDPNNPAADPVSTHSPFFADVNKESSSYTEESATEEDYEAEYDIEYVEDEEGLEGADEGSQESEVFWDTREAKEKKPDPILPWISSGSVDSFK